MLDQKKWGLAISQFQALRKNIPNLVDENLVREYHSILDLFHSSSGEDFSLFHVPDAELKPRVTSSRRASYRFPGSGSASYSREKYCDRDVFMRRVDAAAIYVQSLERMPPAGDMTDSTDYWSMSNRELEQLAIRYNIGCYADQTMNIDRDIIITQLLKRDRALKAPTANATINVGSMQGVIQQGTHQSYATVHIQTADLRSLVEEIKSQLDSLPLSADSKAELVTDIQTVEVQLSTPKPKAAIIAECLRSMRTILESAAGNVTALFLAHEAAKLIGTLH